MGFIAKLGYMDKKSLSEADICLKFITPAIQKAGWDIQHQVRTEVSFTDGKILISGDNFVRGSRKRADYILYYKTNIPLAVIEAKDNRHAIGAGLQQAIEYADFLDVPFVYSSNGDSFIEHDKTGTSKQVEKEISLSNFPSPEALWNRYKKWKGITESEEKVITEDYHADIQAKKPRYYQINAINRTIEAIAKGKNRILLIMATGTGKTYTAFQIIYRLWKSQKKKRILYLADRNILIDQAKNNDLKFFHKVSTKVKNRKVDKSYELYLALYQGVSGNEDWKNIYKQFSRDFFDLIVVDECHRGSAAIDSAWREILEYFSSATQIGMTATPKETKDISNIDYFGEPVYTYSLRQGIEDGFLAPYKVVRVSLDKDLEGWRPMREEKDKYGHEIPDRVYDQPSFERKIVLEKRIPVIAKKITEFLRQTDRYAKTIIFCTDTEHADRMRSELVNENADLVKINRKYVVRITGDDELGKKELDNFIDPASKYPVIVTTSKLLSTGVDVQTCKLIVLESNIQSMTEFKQIIGRGTRVREDYGKYFFTIIDFRNVTNLFADPDFDGEPVQIYSVGPNGPLVNPKKAIPFFENKKDPLETFDGSLGKPRKYYIKSVPITVLNERVQYFDSDGKLITESLKDFTRKTVSKEYASLDDFLKKWKSADKKAVIIEELMNQGLLIEELKEEVGRNIDEFDLICHVAYDKKPLTRAQRVDNVRKSNYFKKYGEKARAVLNSLLDKYADKGIEDIEDIKVLKVNPISKFGTPFEIVSSFGGKEKYKLAIKELESMIYA